jgi:DNA-binding NarL/FixJ family response regulator
MVKTSSSKRNAFSPPVGSIRILVVDDFEPFRMFVLSVFSKTPEFQVVCEASDGLEAVQKAEELKPDVILLDIGLPKLNGIHAARQIRKLAPSSRILFLSQESSADVVQEALDVGAMGYVVKAYAGSDLLAAVEAVCQGKRFVSVGLSGNNLTGGTSSQALGCVGDKDVAAPVAPLVL